MPPPVQTPHESQQTKVHSTGKQTIAAQITATEERFLRAVNDYHFLTVKQAMTCLDYNSPNYVRERLTTLVRNGYLLQGFLSRSAHYGSAPSVFTLTSKAAKHLVVQEVDIPKRYTPTEFDELCESDDFLAHAVAISDVLLSAALLERLTPDYFLLEFRNEHVLQHTPVYVDGVEKNKQTKVLPDGYMEFQLPTHKANGQHHTLPFCLEVDRGTRAVSSFKQQFRARVRYINGPYQQAFHTQTVTIGYAVRCATTEKTIRRARLLRSWAEEVLTEMDQKDDAHFFLFTPLPYDTIDAEQLWLSPIWASPFTTTLQIALDPNA